MSPLPLYVPDVVPSDPPLTPGLIEPGGILELRTKGADRVLTNLVPNPKLANDNVGHSEPRGTNGLPDGFATGMIWTQASTAANAATWTGRTGNGRADQGNGILITAAHWYTALAKVRFTTIGGAALSALSLRLYFYNGSNALVGTTTVASISNPVVNTDYDLIGTPAQVPAGATQVSARVYVTVGGTSNWIAGISGILLAETEQPTGYFDGDMDGGSWSGATNGSTSSINIPVFDLVASLTDVNEGLIHKATLLELDTLEFKIPVDRFSPSIANFLNDEHEKFLAANPGATSSAFAKSKVVSDDLFLFYTDTSTGRDYHFRINELDFDDYENLSGRALEEAVVLSDKLTQYTNVTSQYAGALPSEVGKRVLQGWQRLTPTNPRWVRDRAISMTAKTEIPDMTPGFGVDAPADSSAVFMTGAVNGTDASATTIQRTPNPFTIEVPAVAEKDVAAFPGLPANTVPPQGTKKSKDTGSLRFVSFNEAYDVNSASAVKRVANFMYPAAAGKINGPINFISGALPLVAGEQSKYVSRVVYGAVKATVAGVYGFTFTTNGGLRINFQGKVVFDRLYADNNIRGYGWSAYMEAGKWYPIIINTCQLTAVTRYQFTWQKPGDLGYSDVPAANLSPDLFDDLFLVRYLDSLSVTRFMLAFKRWDGKAIVLAYPLPIAFWSSFLTNGAYWPKSAPAGTTLYEVRFPGAEDNVLSYAWGSGWTRRAGARQTEDGPPVETAVFQAHSSGY